MTMDIAGVLLAGGLATRMGGGDKGLKTVQGRRIIDRVIETVQPQVDHLILNANGEVARFSDLGLDVVPDRISGHPGPMAGILAGMEALPDYRYMLSVPTDTPFLPDDLVRRLREPIDAGRAVITIAHSDGYDHPVIGLWPTKLAADLRRALVEKDMRKLKKWIARYSYETVSWDVDPIDPFFNANKPEDLDSL
ncbi:MAG: molybdenum cofactor guanylyltransferase MobA [Methylocystaceae bacterium]|nr:molybdenum cofactor guanylyltransferase MobA [Methylocystaceae bacterium]